MNYSCCIIELIVILNCIVIKQMAGEKPTILICSHCAQCFSSTKNVDLLITWMPVLGPIVHTPCLTCCRKVSPWTLVSGLFPGGLNVLPLNC